MARAAPSDDTSPEQKTRDEIDRLIVLMRMDRSSWRETWREITWYIMPTRGRYNNLLPNQGSRGLPKGTQIVDRTATKCVGDLAAFLMAGITSPARDWFQLSTNNDQLNDDPDVKQWLAIVQKRLQRVFATGNFYNAMAQLYEEIAGFGTGAVIIQQDYEDVVRFYPLTAGEYFIMQNARMEIDTLVREYVQNVRQVVSKFGYENCSPTVQGLYDSRQLTREIPVVHAIMPNLDRVPGAIGWRGAPYIGVYYEYGNPSVPVLRVEGYPEKPFICPRWHAVSNDAYGHGPAEDALGDVKSLQLAQLRCAEVVDKFARPPMQADAAMQNGLVSLIPNGINFIPGLNTMGNGAGLRPVYQTSPNIAPLVERIRAFQEAIRTTLKNDLILMVSQMDQAQPPTAAEINVRQQEKLLALGPVLERFHNEALNPIINVTLGIMERGGLLPPRPQQMGTGPLKVNYISVLAQAQRATETTGIEQFVRFCGGLVSVDQSVMDNVDLDQAVDIYGNLLSINQAIMRDPQAVAQMRQQREYAQQQQAAAEQAQQMAAGAKNLSDTDVGGGQNALQAIMSGIGGGG
ncbi:portal protein [Komagataeibacter diospyri]|uniref:portal protein n=1 Tax=Komagataeibacter diospyri TaxID=1932662 RepID=UPI0037569DC8